MSGEAFAGETITQKPGARVGRGGVYLKPQDIPNLPQMPQMPLAEPRNVPNIRQDYLKPITGFEQRAAKMQQAPLPGGFKAGLAMAAEATGTGQMAMAKAIENVGESFRTGMMTATNAALKYAAAVNKEREALTVANNTNKLEHEAASWFGAPEQQFLSPEETKEKAAKELFGPMRERVMGMSNSKLNQDKLMSVVSGLEMKYDRHLQTKQSELTHNLTATETLTRFHDKFADGDWPGANEAVDDLLRWNMIDGSKAAVLKGNIADARERQSWYTLHRDIRSQYALDVVKGGKSQFRFLNEPGAAEKEYKFAKEQQTIDDENWSNEIIKRIWENLNGPNKGKNPISDEDIVHSGKVGRHDPRVIEQLRAMNQAPDKSLDIGLLATGRFMVAEYAQHHVKGDAHGALGAPDPKVLDHHIRWAIANLPKKEAQDMITDLKKVFDDELQGVKPTETSKLRDEYVGRIKELGNNGNLISPTGERIPSGTTKDRGETIVDYGQMYLKDKAANEAIDRLDDFVRRNPDAGPQEFTEEFQRIIDPYTKEAAKKGFWSTTWDWWTAEYKSIRSNMDFGKTPAPGTYISPPEPPNPVTAPSIIIEPATREGYEKSKMDTSHYVPGEATNPTIAARRAPYMQQVRMMPDLIAAVIAKEDASSVKGATAVLESLINRTARQSGNVRTQIFNGFYGPVKRGEVQRMLAGGVPDKYRDLAMAAIANVAAGSNLIRGATDQGLYGEIKGKIRRKVGEDYYGYFPGDPEFEA